MSVEGIMASKDNYVHDLCKLNFYELFRN